MEYLLLSVANDDDVSVKYSFRNKMLLKVIDNDDIHDFVTHSRATWSNQEL